MTHEHAQKRTLNYTKTISCLFVFFFVWFSVAGGAATPTSVSDTISTSVPGAGANHTVKFTVTNVIPASGKIIVTPQAGAFSIPVGLDYTDIDFLNDGANQTLSASPGSGSGSAIGVSIITGASSSITFILNNADVIAAGSAVTIKIGANAAFGEVGNQQIQNPVTAGSYKINIKTYNNSYTLIDQADAMVAIVAPVDVSAQRSAPLVTPPVTPPSGEGGGEAGVAAGAAVPVPAPVPATTTPPLPPKLTPTPPPPEPIPTPTPLPTLTPEQITEAQTIVIEAVAITGVIASPETISAVTEAIAQIAALGADISTISADTITAVIQSTEAIAALEIDVTQINTQTLSSVIEAVNTAETLGADITTISSIALATTIQAIDAAVNAGLDVTTIDAQALSLVIEAVDAAVAAGIDVTAINTQTLSSIIQAVNTASYSGVNVAGIDTQALSSVIQAVDAASNSGVNVEAISTQALSSVIQAVNQSVDRGIDVTAISNNVIIMAIQAIDAAAATGADVSKISPQVFSFMVQGFNTAEIAGINLSAIGNIALGTIVEALSLAAESGINIADISFISFASIVKQISDAKAAGADINTIRSIALNAVIQAAEARVSGAEAFEAAKQISSRVLKIANLLGTEALEAIRSFTTGTAGIATIIDNAPNNGRYTWNTRGNLVIGGAAIKGLITEGSDYRIIIFSSIAPSIYESSDASFSFVSPPTALLEPGTPEGLGNLFSSRLFSFFSGGLIAKAQENTAPSLKITYPNGGEKLIIGKKYNIKWESKNLPPGALVNIRVAKGLKLNEIAKVINKEFQKTVNILRGDPAVRKTADDITVPTSVTVTAASAGALTATASTGSAAFAINLSELFQILGLARFYLLGLVRFKRRNPWGKVIDKLSGKPIGLATIQIYESEFKKLKDSQITDDEGRFGALAGPGKYYIKVSKKGFQIFQSDVIEISSPDQILNFELYLSPIAEEWNLATLKKINFLNILKRFIELINPYLLALGTIFSIISAVILPSGFNYGVFYVYIILDLLKIYFAAHLLKPLGKVIDETTNEPLPLTVVRIFEEKKNWLLATKVTDEEGRFNFLLAPGQYYLTFLRAGYEPFHSGAVILKKAGLPSLNVKLKRIE